MTEDNQATQAGAQHHARHLLAAWEQQQAGYVTGREERFEVMLDVLSQVLPEEATVVDLACGPGSISSRVLARFPHMTCLALDFDPVLVALGRDALGESSANRLYFHEVDLENPAWQRVLPSYVDAVLSSTALHWLPPATLVRLYHELATILPAGGIFLNADHLRDQRGRPLLEQLSAYDDRRTQEAARRVQTRTWEQWWGEVEAAPAYGRLLPLRHERFHDRLPTRDLSPEFHCEALRTAGFGEAGTLWQYFDDYIILAQR